MLGIHVAAMPIWWNGRVGARSARCEADLSAERGKRNANARSKLSPSVCTPFKPPDLESWLGELVSQQAKAGNDCRPAPIGRLQIQKLDFQRVSRRCTLDIDRAIHLIYAREVKRTDSLDGTLRCNPTARGIKQVKRHRLS